MRTTDLFDAHEARLRVIDPVFRDFGGVRTFDGAAATIVVHEDNALVRKTLEEPGHGRVLVVDGAGSVRTALVGGNLAALAEKNGWSGIIVFGAVRDVVELGSCSVGIKALAAIPRRSAKAGAGQRDVPVTFAGVRIAPGDIVYADEDGVVVSEERLSL